MKYQLPLQVSDGLEKEEGVNISMAGVFSENEVKIRSLHLGFVGRADQTQVRQLIRANLRGQVWGRL